jgi:hypothetical protein
MPDVAARPSAHNAGLSPHTADGRPWRVGDVWAFGCVLYEMLTGRRAFDGQDTTEVLGVSPLMKKRGNVDGGRRRYQAAIRTMVVTDAICA